MAFDSEAIRNIAVTGHGATGKTSVVEQLLAFGGVIPKAETVEGGKTVSDFTEEENARKISIHLSLSHLEWQERKINLLDTPGASDFAGELVAGLRAAETALVLVAADAGVQIGTIQTWRRLKARGLPRLVFVNKLDKEHADFAAVLAGLKENFQANFVPLTVPIGEGSAFKGVVDLVAGKAYLAPEAGRKAAAVEIPAELAEEMAEHRQALIEAAAEGDDKLMEKFFETETLSDEEIQRGLIGGLASGKLVPVLCGSALQAAGIYSLANALAAICPSPLGRQEPLAAKEGQEATSKAVDPQGPAAGFVFKTSIDQFSGKLSFVKVISGAIRSDTELVTARDRRKEKLNKIYTCQGKKLEDAEALVAGDVGILTKLPTAMTNDTLTAPEAELAFQPLELPQPVHAVAINAVAKKDEDKLNQLLHRAAEEDLTFRIAYNQETKENVISGMGELHLDITLGKIRSQAKIEVETKTPRVAYRETIRGAGAAEYQHKKQTGGHGQYAKVVLEIKPLPRGQQFNFVNGIVGRAHLQGLHPRRGERRDRRHGSRHPGRIPGGGPGSHGGGRQGAPRGLLRAGLQAGRPGRAARVHGESRPGPAGADRQPDGLRGQRVPGRRALRLELPAGPGAGPGTGGRHPGGQGPGAAGRAAALLHRPALHDLGHGILRGGVRPLQPDRREGGRKRDRRRQGGQGSRERIGA